ncbi:hypothetical protein [Vampirovibrio sp.]|uniref:hypothetical protein n=1 Tax=Vampirovibrio sp. TaxID=2717857 RepID=UPI00359412F8
MLQGIRSDLARLSRLQLVYSVLAFCLLLGLCVEVPAFSQTHYTMTAFLRCTRENAIMQAFYLMKESQGERSLRRIVHKPVRVVFKNMAEINKSLRNYDALSWMSSQGEQVIFVNAKHRSAPPEALAALISHEAMHDDELNSLNEEVESWRFEAAVWMELKAKNPTLAKIPEGINALVDRENRLEQETRQGTLEQFVRSSPGYKDLPEDSPGFEHQQVSTNQ